MQVLTADQEHIPQIIEVWEEFAAYHEGMDSFYARAEGAQQAFEHYVRTAIDADEFLVLVAVREARVIGYCITHLAHHPPVVKRQDYGLIMDAAVRAANRRSGAGQAMVSRALEWLDGRGVDRAELYVSAANPSGMAFWQEQGFRTYEHVMYRDL